MLSVLNRLPLVKTSLMKSIDQLWLMFLGCSRGDFTRSGSLRLYFRRRFIPNVLYTRWTLLWFQGLPSLRIRPNSFQKPSVGFFSAHSLNFSWIGSRTDDAEHQVHLLAALVIHTRTAVAHYSAGPADTGMVLLVNVYHHSLGFSGP